MSVERLWAPWRVEYVREIGRDEDCFLCRAARRETPGGAAACDEDRTSLVLWRCETCFAVLNRWPYNNGHLLIAPNEHKGDLVELTERELADQMDMLKRCERNLRSAISPDGFNVGLNLGRTSGAGLADHVHWHLVPRWNGDTNFMPVLASTKVIPQSLEELWELLRQVDGER